MGSDWLRRHLHHPLRQLLLPRLPEETFLVPEDWQSCHQWQSSDQRPQQSRGGGWCGGGGEQEEAKERQSQEGVKVQEWGMFLQMRQKKGEGEVRRGNRSLNITGSIIPANTAGGCNLSPTQRGEGVAVCVSVDVSVRGFWIWQKERGVACLYTGFFVFCFLFFNESKSWARRLDALQSKSVLDQKNIWTNCL